MIPKTSVKRVATFFSSHTSGPLLENNPIIRSMPPLVDDGYLSFVLGVYFGPLIKLFIITLIVCEYFKDARSDIRIKETRK
jgi:hypothetical protein